MDDERVLFVHAHPDDESIATGGTIALLASRGSHVTVVTCTRGERGSIVDPDALPQGVTTGPALTQVRVRELGDALRVLGVADHRFLGAPDAHLPGTPPRRYLDSGMRWGGHGRAEAVDDAGPDALTSAAFADVAADIAAVIADVRPTAVVSYDDGGGYGHPDHVLAARAARRAAEVMAVPFWSIAVDGRIDVEVDVTPVLETKRQALAAHRSQLVVERDRFHGPDDAPWEPIADVERFRIERLADGDVADESWATQGAASRVIVLLLAVLAGGLGGFVVTAAHGQVLAWFAWAATAGIIGCLVLFAGLRLAFASRLPTIAAAVGVIVASALLMTRGLLGEDGGVDLPGILWLVGAPLAAVIVLLWPSSRRTSLARAGRIVAAPHPEGPAAP